jgi:hypothetical protein
MLLRDANATLHRFTNFYSMVLPTGYSTIMIIASLCRGGGCVRVFDAEDGRRR